MGLFTKRQPGQFARRAPIANTAQVVERLDELIALQTRTNELLERMVPPAPQRASMPPPGPAGAYPSRHGR